MKKQRSLFLLLLMILVGTAKAQTTYLTKTEPEQIIHISGTVQTKQGDILHLAFVQDKHYKNGTYTDSLGNFELTVSSTSKLFVSCRGFKDTVIDINNRASFLIVLSGIGGSKKGGAGVVDENQNINMAAYRDQVMLNEPTRLTTATYERLTVDGGVQTVAGLVGGPDMAQGAIFPVFHHKDETQGSRYLFETWVHGYVVNNKDSIVQNPLFFFNYDKMGGNLLLTKDKHAAIEVYKDLIKSFTLFDDLNQPSTYIMVPEIDKTHFVQVIATGDSYRIYKSIKTKFVAANYSSDGIASTGNNFDSYEDESAYYLLDVKTKQLQKLALRKKAIKEVFAKEPDKVNKFVNDNSNSSIDDSYLSNLGHYMNK